MSIVLPLSRYRPSAVAPLAIFIDLQREFLLEGRPMRIAGIRAAIDNCQKLLIAARENRLAIAHIRLSPKAVAFNECAGGSDWIEGFTPYGSEMVFERLSPSAYSNPNFLRMMEENGGTAAILAGLCGSTSCLATLIDAERYKHNVAFVFDASTSNAKSFDKESVIHDAAVQIASQFVEVISTSAAIDQLNKQN